MFGPPRSNPQAVEPALENDPTLEADPGDAEAPPDPGADAGPQQFPCSSCGARLVYQPGSTDLVCPYCGGANHIPQSAEEIRELDYAAHLEELVGREETVEHQTLKCQRCAAEFDRPPNVTALACPFCGADIVATAHLARHIKPKSLLPFTVTRDEAVASFRRWLKGLWFAPSALKEYARRDPQLEGMYCPYWTYDSDTVSFYRGWRGVYYWVTVGSGKNRRRVRRTRWYRASGTVFLSFDDVLINASESLPRKLADGLEPWDLQNLTPYNDSFLAGFTSESYQVDVREGFGRARIIMDVRIREAVRRHIGGDTQRIDSIQSEYKNITFKHTLLPIWMSAYRFRDRAFRFLVNGRTGRVRGERPWSWIKITLAVLGGLTLLGGAVWLAQQMGLLD